MKRLIKNEIFSKHFSGDLATIRFFELPKNIQEDDIIEIRREEAYFSENNSYDAFTELVVLREEEETDEEYQKRIADEQKDKERSKKKRYETYLKLKEEFEPKPTPINSFS